MRRAGQERREVRFQIFRGRRGRFHFAANGYGRERRLPDHMGRGAPHRQEARVVAAPGSQLDPAAG